MSSTALLGTVPTTWPCTLLSFGQRFVTDRRPARVFREAKAFSSKSRSPCSLMSTERCRLGTSRSVMDFSTRRDRRQIRRKGASSEAKSGFATSGRSSMQNDKPHRHRKGRLRLDVDHPAILHQDHPPDLPRVDQRPTGRDDQAVAQPLPAATTSTFRRPTEPESRERGHRCATARYRRPAELDAAPSSARASRFRCKCWGRHCGRGCFRPVPVPPAPARTPGRLPDEVAHPASTCSGRALGRRLLRPHPPAVTETALVGRRRRAEWATMKSEPDPSAVCS